MSAVVVPPRPPAAAAADIGGLVPGSRVGDSLVGELPALWVPPVEQWISTTRSRVVGDGYSWLQAVHWVVGSGVYRPRRSHGPQEMGEATIRIARELAKLDPCRPGMDYLVRVTGLSERTVAYHLGMLRECGLLAYIVRGTRVKGDRPQASEYALVIPPAFDSAMGIRTVGEGAERRVTGCAEAGWEQLAALGRKACRRARRPRRAATARMRGKAGDGGRGSRAAAMSARPRCTPMEGGSEGSSDAAGTSVPSEDKLAGGKESSTTAKKPAARPRGHRHLNRVGRRFQLARELVGEIGWLRGCSVARIAWVARHVADAGWSAAEVRAWLHHHGVPERPRRPSGMLAVALRTALLVLPTAEARQAAVGRWHAAIEAERRHRIQRVRDRCERYDGDWLPPGSAVARSQAAAALAQLFAPQPRHAADADEGQVLPQLGGLEDLSPAELAESRAHAWAELREGQTTLVMFALKWRGRRAAEQLYGADLVHRAQQLAGGTGLMTVDIRLAAPAIEDPAPPQQSRRPPAEPPPARSCPAPTARTAAAAAVEPADAARPIKTRAMASAGYHQALAAHHASRPQAARRADRPR